MLPLHTWHATWHVKCAHVCASQLWELFQMLFSQGYRYISVFKARALWKSVAHLGSAPVSFGWELCCKSNTVIVILILVLSASMKRRIKVRRWVRVKRRNKPATKTRKRPLPKPPPPPPPPPPLPPSSLPIEPSPTQRHSQRQRLRNSEHQPTRHKGNSVPLPPPPRPPLQRKQKPCQSKLKRGRGLQKVKGCRQVWSQAWVRFEVVLGLLCHGETSAKWWTDTLLIDLAGKLWAESWWLWVQHQYGPWGHGYYDSSLPKYSQNAGFSLSSIITCFLLPLLGQNVLGYCELNQLFCFLYLYLYLSICICLWI